MSMPKYKIFRPVSDQNFIENPPLLWYTSVINIRVPGTLFPLYYIMLANSERMTILGKSREISVSRGWTLTMDETYCYHMMKLNGFVSFDTDMLEGIFEIFYTGAITYLIQETKQRDK